MQKVLSEISMVRLTHRTRWKPGFSTRSSSREISFLRGPYETGWKPVPLRTFRGRIFHRRKISFFAAGHEGFGDGLQFFPPLADVFCFVGRDVIVAGGGGDDGEQVGEFLHDLIGGGDKECRVRVGGFGIADEKSAGVLADPVNEAGVVRDADERLHAVEGIDRAAAVALVRFRPFINHRQRKSEIGCDLLGAGGFKNFAEEFMRLHAQVLAKRRRSSRAKPTNTTENCSCGREGGWLKLSARKDEGEHEKYLGLIEDVLANAMVPFGLALVSSLLEGTLGHLL